MNKKSQSKTGLKTGKDFSWSEREMIVKDYLSSKETKQSIWEKYSGQQEEHGQLIKWMRHLGYVESPPVRRRKSRRQMKSHSSNPSPNVEQSQLQELRNHIAALEKQLQEAKMQAQAYSMMVDIAEKELKIKIRKKSDTQASKG